MATNSFKPEFNTSELSQMNIMEFTERNIFYLILVVGIIIITFYIIYVIRFRKQSLDRKVESSFNFKVLRDESDPLIIQNNELECPQNLNKYTFSFYLEIHDYYSNRGYWKCIMLKGSNVNELNNNKCSMIHKTINDNDVFQFKGKNNCVIPGKSCKEKYDACADNNRQECDKLVIDSENERISVYENTDLFNRIDKICTAHKLGESGKQLFCCGVEKCGYFKDKNGNPVKLSSGQCMDYLNRYKTYCNKVYATDKKVARSSEEIRMKKNRNVNSETKYYDDYDNICSVDNLLEQYPELLPSSIELGKELELVNLSEKNNMDVGNPNVNDYSMEGLYLNTDISSNVENPVPAVSNVNLENCNSQALEEGYNFFAINLDSDNNNEKVCKMVKIENEEDLYNTQKKSKTECSFIETNDIREGSANCYFVSKARRPDELVVIKCWEDIIRKYPYQNPGVWMHPYINNLRIVFTTFTNTKIEKYNDHLNDIVHPHKENRTNYNIEPINNIDEHPNTPDNARSSSGQCKSFNPSLFNSYREYFDIENIPIKEKFHLAIVTNDKTIEVYINGNLKTSQVLFGNPRYNDGNLQINPGRVGTFKDSTNETRTEKILLGGTISNFDYIPYNLNSSNVYNLMNKTSSTQRSEQGVITSTEHAHYIEISHDHQFDQDTEHGHKHGVDDSNIPERYYIE